MELKEHIQISSTMMITGMKLINRIDIHGEREYCFLYGINEKHISLKRMFKEIIRIIWLKR